MNDFKYEDKYYFLNYLLNVNIVINFVSELNTLVEL